jgi:hypothetical protein
MTALATLVRVKAWHRPLMIIAAAMVVLAFGTAVGMVVDDRTLLGVPVWLKPFKFAVSLAIYTATIAWLISMIERGRRIASVFGGVIAFVSLVEMAVIAGQAARGRRSHFNETTTLDANLFKIMGASIGLLWLITLCIGVLLLIQRTAPGPEILAVRLGIFISAAGMSVAFFMIKPLNELLPATGRDPDTITGAHSVGVPDGGPGLPVVNWSTEAGDLRVGHFIGIHALQALPLLAMLLVYLSRRVSRLREEAVRSRLIVVAGVAYAGLMVLVTWQALRAQPLLRPDALTLMAAGLLIVLTLVPAIVILTRRPVSSRDLAAAPALSNTARTPAAER